MCLKVEEYDYDIVYKKKRKYNTNTDSLSRIQIYPLEIDAKAVEPDEELNQLLNKLIEAKNRMNRKELQTPEILPTNESNSPIELRLQNFD